MRKTFAFLIAAFGCMAVLAAMAADFQVKKSSSVKKQEKSGLESMTSGSLLPGVIGLVTNVSALNKQQKELKAECIPSNAEVEWVNKMVKEYAKIGKVTAKDMRGSDNKCRDENHYKNEVEMLMTSDPSNICTPVFTSTGNDEIWVDYPMVVVAEYCADGSSLSDCSSSKKKKESNIYTIFGKLGFDQEDYLTDEATMYVKMMEKAEKCAPERLSAASKQAYANFLKTTIAGAGQSTNTGTIWDAVGGLTQGNGLSGVGNLAPTVLQLMGE